MSEFYVIRALILFENVLGVYRNRALLNQRLRCSAKFRVFIETSLFMLYFVYCVKICLELFSTRGGVTFNVLQLYSTLFMTVNSLASIVLSYYYSYRYKELIFNIDAIHKICKNDVIYKSVVAKRKKRGYIDLAVFITAIIWSQVLHLRDAVIKENYFALLFLAEAILEFRYHTESVVFYELSEVVGSCLEYFSKSVLESVGKLNRANRRGLRVGEELWAVRQELDRWGDIWRLETNANDCLQDCFGNQIALAFFSSTPIYIGLAYILAINYLGAKVATWFHPWGFLLTLALYVAIKVLILVAGQRVQNEADSLETSLARLHCLLLTIPGVAALECARVLRSLSRRVRAAPVRVRLHPALPVRAALLVDILAVVVNYTIILLQFNHVL